MLWCNSNPGLPKSWALPPTKRQRQMLGGHKYSTSCPKSSLESNLIHFFLYVSSEQHIPVIMSLKRIMFVRLLNHDARRLTQRVTHTAAMVIREKKISAWTPFYFKTMLLAYNLLFSHLFSLLLFFFSFIWRSEWVLRISYHQMRPLK